LAFTIDPEDLKTRKPEDLERSELFGP